MNKIICEMCGSADLVKKEGFFVCQSCGVKYSIEEARKLMIEGTVQIEGTVKIDNSSLVKNFLDIAKNSLAGGNGVEAFDYANKALEVSPNNVDAWLIKMESIKYTGTIGVPRIAEVVSSGKNAILNASPDQKSQIELKVYRYYLVRSLELLQLATNKLGEIKEIKDTYRNLYLITNASKACLTADSGFVNLMEGLANEAIALTKTIPEEIVKDSKVMQSLMGEVAKQYEYETEALENRYESYGAHLLDTAKNIRKVQANEIRKFILSPDGFIKRIEAKKVKMEKEFAEQRGDEYAVIKQKKDYIKLREDRIAALQSEIASLESHYRDLKSQKSMYENEDRMTNKIIQKNQDKLFGKEKAKTACDEARREIDANALKIKDIEDQIKKMNDYYLSKKQEVQKINSEIDPIKKDITDLCERMIFPGVGE